MKKTIAIILTIITILALCSCGSKEKEYELAKPAESVNAYTAPENADQQKQLIDQMKATWALPAEYSPWYYAITDLDRNGRLEVITAATQGTGIFTYAEFWEVTEGFDGLNHCTTDAKAEGDAWPEIIVDSAPCYEDSGKYYYVFQDDAKSGPAEYYTAKMAVCLDKGNVSRTFIASKYVEYIDGGAKMNVICEDSNGREITESEFEFATEKFFSGKTPETVQLSWTEVDEKPIREPELVFADDLFDGYGFVHKQCDATGVYDFASINSEGIIWEVYILDKEFTDAERFIPQAYPCALKGDGSVSVKEGEWIYVYCPCNQWTMQEAPEGCAYSWGLNPNKEYTERENAAPEAAGPDVVITKSPTSETLTVGGKTWFIAYADNADKAEWQFINPADGRAYSPEQAAAMNKGLETEVLEQNTLAVSNVPLSLNGWQVQAVFSGGGKSAVTDPAAIYVGDYLSAYSSVLEAYKTGSGDIIYTPLDEALKKGCYGNAEGIGIMATMVQGTGYYFKDINKDGTPELFIGSSGSDEYEDFIIDSFTLKNGAPCRIVASSERCLYRLRRDNLISNHGSSGAADSMDLLLRFSPEGLSVEAGAALYGEPGAGDFKYYKIKDTTLTRPNADVLSEQEYTAIVDDIHSKDLKFSVTKIK